MKYWSLFFVLSDLFYLTILKKTNKTQMQVLIYLYV